MAFPMIQPSAMQANPSAYEILDALLDQVDNRHALSAWWEDDFQPVLTMLHGGTRTALFAKYAEMKAVYDRYPSFIMLLKDGVDA